MTRGFVIKKLLLISFIFFGLGSSFAYANAGPDTVFINGLEVRDERRVVIEKEKLFISKKLVSVDYDFRNTSNEEVVCGVYFPTPPERYNIFDHRDFGNFKVSCDGLPIEVVREYHAFVNGQDVSEELKKAGLKVIYSPNEKLGYEFEEAIKKISPEQIQVLIDKKIIHKYYYEKKPGPNWEVRTNYHWRQEFPAGKIVHLSLNYSPWLGYKGFDGQKIQELCKPIKDALENYLNQRPNENIIITRKIDYILTTANLWQTPIKDFELITESDKGERVTFCWDDQIENLGDGKFRVQKKDFVPKNDLKVYFIKDIKKVGEKDEIKR